MGTSGNCGEGHPGQEDTAGPERFGLFGVLLQPEDSEVPSELTEL